LGNCAVLGARKLAQCIYQVQIVNQRGLLKARLHPPRIVSRQVCQCAEIAREKAATQRAIGNKADSQFAAGCQQAVRGIAHP
jgi:hypothetical protein